MLQNFIKPHLVVSVRWSEVLNHIISDPQLKANEYTLVGHWLEQVEELAQVIGS